MIRCVIMKFIAVKTFYLPLAIGISFGFCFAYITLLPFRYSLSMYPPEYLQDYKEICIWPPLDNQTSPVQSKEKAKSPAEDLEKKIKVLCWVMTSPQGMKSRAKHLKATWGSRCNILLFMSSEKDHELPTVQLNVKEGRNYLWAKTKEAFKYIYENHFDDADWFMKADDDTYVILENLRYMLNDYNNSTPIYFGCKFKPLVEQGYMSGGAGYVLSKEAVRLLVETGLPNKTMCRPGHVGNEDVELGKCLQNVGVVAGDSRDSAGRSRFFPFTPEHHLFPEISSPKDFWYWRYVYYDTKDGLKSMSDTAVSFHYVSPRFMHVIDYFLYHIRPYGVVYDGVPEDVTTTHDDITDQSP